MGNLLAAIFLEAAWRDFCAMFGLDPDGRQVAADTLRAFQLHVFIKGTWPEGSA